MGDRFAAALIAKAQEGVPVRLIVDRQGSDPEGGSREFYERLTEAGIQVCVTRATKLRAPRGPLGAGGATGWNLSGLGHIDHRKVVVVDGRIGWVGGAGIEDHFENGEFHDLFVRVEGPVVAQLQLVFVASLRWLGGEIPPDELPELFPHARRGLEPRAGGRAPQRAGPVQADHDRDRSAHRRSAGDARRREPVRHRPRHDRANREGGSVAAPACACSCPRTRTTGPAARPSSSTTSGCSTRACRLLGYPKMLHAKAFVADGEQVLVGTCNLEAWSLKRFFEIDIGFESTRSRGAVRGAVLRPRRGGQLGHASAFDA